MEVTYESQGKPLLTIADAIEAESFFKHPGAKVLQVGDAKGKKGSYMSYVPHGSFYTSQMQLPSLHTK